MKKFYFAKNLPVKTLDGQEQKLYICTRKIEVGDTDIVTYTKKGNMFISHKTGLTFDRFLANGRAYLKKEGCTISSSYPFEYHNDKLHGIEADTFKVIGLVSELAKWVKEDDVFYKTDLDFTVTSNDKSSKYLEIGDPVTVKPDANQTVYQTDKEGVITKIKYKETDQYGDHVPDWDDEIEVGEVVQGTFSPHNDLEYKKLTDLIESRRNLQFKPINYTICKIKCSQCETFH